MNLELISTAYAQDGGAPKGNAPFWPMLLALFAIFYFFMIRPQQKKQKESQQMMKELQAGDKVVTIGGICGTILNIKSKKDDMDDDVVVLRVSDSTKIEMTRSSIAKVVSKKNEEKKS